MDQEFGTDQGFETSDVSSDGLVDFLDEFYTDLRSEAATLEIEREAEGCRWQREHAPTLTKLSEISKASRLPWFSMEQEVAARDVWKASAKEDLKKEEAAEAATANASVVQAQSSTRAKSASTKAAEEAAIAKAAMAKEVEEAMAKAAAKAAEEVPATAAATVDVRAGQYDPAAILGAGYAKLSCYKLRKEALQKGWAVNKVVECIDKSQLLELVTSCAPNKVDGAAKAAEDAVAKAIEGAREAHRAQKAQAKAVITSSKGEMKVASPTNSSQAPFVLAGRHPIGSDKHRQQAAEQAPSPPPPVRRAKTAQKAAEEIAPAAGGNRDINEVVAEAKKQFDTLDVERRGALKRKQLAALADWVWIRHHPSGVPLSDKSKEEHAAKLMLKLDANKDGTMTFDEFVSWFKRSSKLVERYNTIMAAKTTEVAAEAAKWKKKHDKAAEAAGR